LNKNPDKDMYFYRAICLLNKGDLQNACKDLKIASGKGHNDAKEIYGNKCYTPGRR